MAEGLTTLVRESMVHLEVLLSQQEEVILKPLEHFVQVQAKVAKQAKERYDRERTRYLAALTKYQGLRKGASSASAATAKDEAAMHARIFDDARFEAAIKLGGLACIRDTQYLEQLCQMIHLWSCFFSQGGSGRAAGAARGCLLQNQGADWSNKLHRRPNC